MNKVEHSGWIKKGCLFLSSKGRFKGELQAFPDCDVTVIVKKKGKRSSPQNRYYWGIVVKTIQIEFNRRGFRMDDQQVHEFLKLHFNKKYIHNDDGEVIAELGGTTTEMNKDEFAEFLEKIFEWCSSKLDIVIPPPSTQTEIFSLP